MRLEKGRISGRHVMFAVLCFMHGTILHSGFIISLTRNDSWAMPFTSFLLALPLVGLYAALMDRFPSMSLIEISDAVFGRVLGKAVSALYLFFFLSLCALNTRDLGSFVVSRMMPETPMPAVLILFLLACTYAVVRGIENLLRLSVLFAAIALGALFFNSTLTLKDVQFSFLEPAFQLPLMDYVQGTVTIAAIPMGEILAFTMISPMMGKGKKTGGPLALGLAISATAMAVAILRDIVTMGPLVSIMPLASYESVRYISVAGILTRMESIYAVVLVILQLFKVSILMYAFVLGLSQLLGLTSTSPLMLLSAALVLCYSLLVFESGMENTDWGASAAPFFSLTFELLLPAVSLLTARLRGLDRAREAGT
jgi:spore germination protein KB